MGIIFVTLATLVDTGHDTIGWIAYFYRPGCKECDRVEYVLNNIKLKFTNIEIRRYDVAYPNNLVLLDNIGKKYKVPDKLRLITPAIFVGDTFFIKQISDRAVYEAITSSRHLSPPWEKVKPTNEGIIGRFKQFSPIGVIGAGLLDGINPCAFATIIFFISYLTFAAYKKRELLLVGIAFTMAVFVAYLCIGLGLFKFVSAIKVFPLISKITYYIIACLAFVLGIISLYDYTLYRKGKLQEMKLQLPSFIKRLIHQIIRKEMKKDEVDKRHGSFLLCTCAFISGLFISVLEVVCTGQVYLPTITYIVGISVLRARAIFYLLIYNIFFVLPLVFVFMLAYFGVSSYKMGEIMKRRLGSVKLALGCLFFGLGSALIGTQIYLPLTPQESTKIDIYSGVQSPFGIFIKNLICGLQDSGLNADISVYFTDITEMGGEFYSPYGEEAVEEAKRQLIIQYKFKDKFHKYLLLRNKDGYNKDWRKAAKAAGIDEKELTWTQAFVPLLRENIGRWKLIAKTPEALFINGQRYNGKLDSESILRAIRSGKIG